METELRNVLSSMMVDKLREEAKKFNEKQEKKIIKISQPKDELIENIIEHQEHFQHLMTKETKFDKKKDKRSEVAKKKEDEQIAFFTSLKYKTFVQYYKDIKAKPNDQSLIGEVGRKWAQLSSSMKSRLKAKSEKLFEFMENISSERKQQKEQVSEKNKEEREKILTKMKEEKKKLKAKPES